MVSKKILHNTTFIVQLSYIAGHPLKKNYFLIQTNLKPKKTFKPLTLQTF